MANIWNKLNKLNKSNYEISKETNIPEEKVNEIMKGERQLPTDKVDEFVKVLKTDNKVQKQIKLVEVKKWYESTDLKARRIELGYTTQRDLAKELKLDTSCICRLENKSDHKVSDDTLIRYYDFMTDDLNKKIVNKEDAKRRKSRKMKISKKVSEKERDMIQNIDFNEVLEWYKNFDLRQWLKDRRWSHGDLAKELGYKSASSITDMLNNKSKNGIKDIKNHRIVMTRVYLYIKNLEEIKYLKEDNKEDEEEIEILDESDIIDSKIEYHNEPVEPKCIIRPSSERGTILRLEYELEEARKQIARYEKLIDMIGIDRL